MIPSKSAINKYCEMRRMFSFHFYSVNIWVFPRAVLSTLYSARKEAKAGREREFAGKLTKVWLPLKLSGKEFAWVMWDPGLILKLGTFSGEHGNPLLYSH